MRYEFVGRKSIVYGKTLWEIVGNLKNFGVGRLLKVSNAPNETAPSFFKILDIQPLPPKKKEFEYRCVIAAVDGFYNGVVLPTKNLLHSTGIPKFHLIPKIEEEKYLKRAEGLKPPVKYITKYCNCPPLYKILWEQDDPQKGEMPKLKTKVQDYNSRFNIIVKDEELKPFSCSLYKTDMTVSEMYQEIVRLKKILKSGKNLQQ